jgi:hypothetical protein
MVVWCLTAALLILGGGAQGSDCLCEDEGRVRGALFYVQVIRWAGGGVGAGGVCIWAVWSFLR